MTTLGRVLCLVLSIYAITVFGYIAATLASYFIGRDAAQAVHPADVQSLQQAVDQLNEQLLKSSAALKNTQQETEPPKA